MKPIQIVLKPKPQGVKCKTSSGLCALNAEERFAFLLHLVASVLKELPFESLLAGNCIAPFLMC